MRVGWPCRQRGARGCVRLRHREARFAAHPTAYLPRTLTDGARWPHPQLAPGPAEPEWLVIGCTAARRLHHADAPVAVEPGFRPCDVDRVDQLSVRPRDQVSESRWRQVRGRCVLRAADSVQVHHLVAARPVEALEKRLRSALLISVVPPSSAVFSTSHGRTIYGSHLLAPAAINLA